MLRKLYGFQRLFFHSPQARDIQPAKLILTAGTWMIAAFLTANLFAGNTLSSETTMPIYVGAISVMLINRILNGNRLFETVPVGKKFIVFNVYLASALLATGIFLGLWIFGLTFFGIIAGVAYFIMQSQGQISPPNMASELVIDSLKGNLFMLLVLIIILLVGTTIAFVKNRRYRSVVYLAFFIIGYALLAYLKLFMPISPSTGRVEFLESLILMPGIDGILLWLVIATLLLLPLSVYIGYKLYLTPLRTVRHRS